MTGAFSLALGGTLLAAAPANAVVVEKILVVTSPDDGATVESRTVEFTGLGAPNATILVTSENELDLGLTTTTVGEDRTWSVSGTFTEEAAIEQNLVVTHIDEQNLIETETLTLTLPEVPAEAGIVVSSPEEGELVASRQVSIMGTAPAGATITVTDADGVVRGTAELGEETEFSIPVDYADDVAIIQTVTVGGVVVDRVLTEVVRSFLLPVVAELPAPVITSPMNGEVLRGDSVIFTGTGVPGENILLAAVPSDALEAAEDGQSAPAAPAPADPTSPIVVDADGNWTVTLALIPGVYTAAATHVSLDESGNLLTALSPASVPVEFTLAAVVVEPPVVVPVGNGGEMLADTGAEDGATLGAAGLGVLLLLAGAAVVVGRRLTRTPATE